MRTKATVAQMAKRSAATYAILAHVPPPRSPWVEQPITRRRLSTPRRSANGNGAAGTLTRAAQDRRKVAALDAARAAASEGAITPDAATEGS